MLAGNAWIDEREIWGEHRPSTTWQHIQRLQCSKNKDFTKKDIGKSIIYTIRA